MMKKLRLVLGVFGASVTSSSLVVSCSKKTDDFWKEDYSKLTEKEKTELIISLNKEIEAFKEWLDDESSKNNPPKEGNPLINSDNVYKTLVFLDAMYKISLIPGAKDICTENKIENWRPQDSDDDEVETIKIIVERVSQESIIISKEAAFEVREHTKNWVYKKNVY